MIEEHYCKNPGEGNLQKQGGYRYGKNPQVIVKMPFIIHIH